MIRLYRSLLALYPPLDRYVFADEMTAVFRQAQAEVWQKGLAARARFCLRELAGLLRGAANAHLCSLAENHPWCTLLQRSFLMRSEYRYPRTSIALMTVILAIVVVTIAKAQGLAYTVVQIRMSNPGIVVPRALANLGPSIAGWPVHYGLLASIALGFVLAWVAGLAAWAVTFALRRSGVHRLDHAQTWPQSSQLSS